MITNTFNRVLAASAAALIAITNVHGVLQDPCQVPPEQICCDSDFAPGPFAFAFPKEVGLACPSDLYVWGEFLYMQACEDGLEYAISTAPCSDLTDGDDYSFPVKGGHIEGFSTGCNDWDWNPGFRIGFGTYICHDAWALQAEWTNLNITNHTGVHLSGSSLIIPLWMTSDAEHHGGNNIASARWDADYNTFDVRIGKPYHVSRYLIAHPHFGIRAAWIDQCYTAEYSGFFTDEDGEGHSPPTPAVDGASFDADNDFWGIGTRVGIDTEWYLGRGAFLFGNFAASLIFGKFDIDETFSAGPLSSGMNNDLEHEFKTTIPNYEIQLGLAWGTNFYDDKYHITVALGWEFQYWWDLNRMRRWQDDVSPIYNDTVSRGDFSTNGISFKAQFDF